MFWHRTYKFMIGFLIWSAAGVGRQGKYSDSRHAGHHISQTETAE